MKLHFFYEIKPNTAPSTVRGGPEAELWGRGDGRAWQDEAIKASSIGGVSLNPMLTLLHKHMHGRPKALVVNKMASFQVFLLASELQKN